MIHSSYCIVIWLTAACQVPALHNLQSPDNVVSSLTNWQCRLVKSLRGKNAFDPQERARANKPFEMQQNCNWLQRHSVPHSAGLSAQSAKF